MADTITPSPSPRRRVSGVRQSTKNHVNRTRRSVFAFFTVSFSLIMMAYLAVAAHGKGITNEAAMSALEGFKEVAIWIGAAYIGGSAVDYSAAMISRRYQGGGGRGRFDDGEEQFGEEMYGRDRFRDERPDGRISD